MKMCLRLKFVDRLYDSLFGYVNLTKVEKEIIHTPIFQRLHHINQLGLANIIFPTALHTRFSHSLGVLFIMDKLVTHIREKYAEYLSIDDTEHQLLRLAALLHDIGHLPFSHSGEEATAQASAKEKESELLEPNPAVQQEQPSWWRPTKAKLHEKLSRLVVENWEDLIKIFRKYDLDYEEIGRIIVGGSADLYKTLLLHSELDADRLDYLLRDSSFLGVSYGNIELEHIISMIACNQIEGQPIIGVSHKGIHAIEHYILARYFMYSQVVFYPKIWYLESLLKDIYQFMIGIPEPEYHIFNEEELKAIIINNEYHKYYDFNDHYLYYKMRLLHDYLQQKYPLEIDSKEFIVNEKLKLVLSGQIPEPLILHKAFITDDEASKILLQEKEIRDKIKQICENYSLPYECITWGFVSTRPTKLKESYKIGEAPPADATEEAIRIIYPNGQIIFFVQEPGTLLKDISKKRLQCFYLFANPLIVDKLCIDCNQLKKDFRNKLNLESLF